MRIDQTLLAFLDLPTRSTSLFIRHSIRGLQCLLANLVAQAIRHTPDLMNALCPNRSEACRKSLRGTRLVQRPSVAPSSARRFRLLSTLYPDGHAVPGVYSMAHALYSLSASELALMAGLFCDPGLQVPSVNAAG